MKRKVFNVILVLVSMFSIFMFSSENASSSTKTSQSVAKEVVSIVIKDEVKVNKIVNKDFVIYRKLAHLTEFFILGFLLVNVWADGKSNITFKYILVAVLIALIYAVSDEVHQTLIPGRAGRVMDVVIDTFGALLGSLTYYGIFKFFRKKSG